MISIACQHHFLFWKCSFITDCQRRRHAPWPPAGWGSWCWVPPSLAALAPAHRPQHYRQSRLHHLSKVISSGTTKTNTNGGEFHNFTQIYFSLLRDQYCDNLLSNQNWWRLGTFWKHQNDYIITDNWRQKNAANICMINYWENCHNGDDLFESFGHRDLVRPAENAQKHSCGPRPKNVLNKL